MSSLSIIVFTVSCAQKNILRNFKKPIDNHVTVWYNQIKNIRKEVTEMDLQQLIIGGGATFLWLFVAIAAAVLESMTCDLVAIWFVPGALSAMLLSIFVPSIGWQIAVFLILSVAVLVLAKTVFKKYMPKVRKNVMNTDALIGARAVVAEEINNLHGTGSVKVNGVVWTARAVDPNATVEAGSVVIIKQIEGVKLICMPEENTQNN